MDWTWYLFRFDGRINRALLWQALLIVALLAGLLEIAGQVIGILAGTRSTLKLGIELDFDFGLDGLFTLVDPRASHSLASADLATAILKTSGMALFFWIYLATAIKRLHDRDRSGWWIVPFFFLPGLFGQFADLLPKSSWMLPLSLPFSILWVWGLVEMFCRPGTSGHNRFGPDPLLEIEDSSSSSAPPAKSWDQSHEIEIVPPSASPPGGMHVKRGA
ncbi:uncharacterized membrane protein YhaH (DUF805 family) [Bradyrhizobium huanghuaihaiense]|uniref:Uncharacterized membrane protein YhaH (DUF805 family) n=1 Tax=Bradyrhizobium huanghuaihaiense TaxID=990078 RepID=A0A562QIA9_9BRAD|nr:DUF805 domain-containing protein [Bradyrhizobium huanghuaihaiense]TWI56469.1 uncharacterized membrane protein YhaH (DUF805 family) [Bradyrhizobium huanghuaihaiense]